MKNYIVQCNLYDDNQVNGDAVKPAQSLETNSKDELLFPLLIALDCKNCLGKGVPPTEEYIKFCCIDMTVDAPQLQCRSEDHLLLGVESTSFNIKSTHLYYIAESQFIGKMRVIQHLTKQVL